MFQKLEHTLYEKRYSFNILLGLLIAKNTQSESPNSNFKNEKFRQAYQSISNPYLIDKTYSHINMKYSKWMKIYASILIWCSNHFYIGLLLISTLRLNVFENAAIGCEMFYKMFPKNQNMLCLPRSIFAATMSKRFKQHGVLVIGAFLPSHRMHSWVMEDNRITDMHDTIWINYTPLLMVG